MSDISFYVTMQQTAAGNGLATLSYQVSTNNELKIKSIRQSSTAAFNVIGIRGSGNLQYSNASATVPIPNTFFASGASPNIGYQDLPQDLILTGGSTIYFDVKDTSGSSNVITIVLSCILTTA